MYPSCISFHTNELILVYFPISSFCLKGSVLYSSHCFFYLTVCPGNHFVSVHRNHPYFCNCIVVHFIYFSQSPIYGHMGYFQDFAITSSVTMNNIMHMYICVFIFLEMYPQDRFLELRLLT